MVKLIRIIKAEYAGDHKVKLFFSDRTQRVVDFGDFILGSTYQVFNQYKDLKKFRKFKIENGNILWGKDWDLIFPLEQLYKGKISLPRIAHRSARSQLSLVAEPPSIYTRLKKIK